MLTNQYKLVKLSKIWKPSIASRATLMHGCTAKHLFLLNYSLYVSKVIEMPLCFLPGVLAR